MKRFFAALRRFFLPPADEKVFTRILPLFAVAFIVILLFAFANYAWEGTNAPTFCGLTCHTMPPEYVTYQNSSHTNIACEDCHMGRDTLAVMVKRKVVYSWQTGTAMLFNTYHYPIVAKNMAPAREACENCHKPEKFSSDKLVEIKTFAEDKANTPSSTFLVLHTGGGAQRQGLGYGIHWHIENPVFYYATDSEQQNIPYVAVMNPDGTKTEYLDVQSNVEPAKVTASQLKKMDCITCHNRTAHLIENPQTLVDSMISRGQVSLKIPEIKKKAVEVMSASYDSEKAAMDGIAALNKYYQGENVDADLLTGAIQSLQTAWKQSNFLDQKADWQTHPNNIGHQNSAGCFRCHDGKHLAQVPGQNPATVRLECNLCHSVPVVSAPNIAVANMQLSKGIEPSSHKSANWITLHRQMFNDTCKGCHSVDDMGGTSNVSFCSNSQCHGATWKYAGFDAPKLAAVIAAEAISLKPTPKATPQITPTSTPDGTNSTALADPGSSSASEKVSYTMIQPFLKEKCGSCHGSGATKGLDVTTYETLMMGSNSGSVVNAGQPDQSLIVKIQSQTSPHFGQLSADELAQLAAWIKGGALEK